VAYKPLIVHTALFSLEPESSTERIQCYGACMHHSMVQD